MLMGEQSESASTFPNSSGGMVDTSPIRTGLWKDADSDVSTLFFPTNLLEPSTPETFLELDPAGFFAANSSATKRSCVTGMRHAQSSQYGPAAAICWGRVEPSREPCTDEIPWSDLVFWLGNASTGEVVCSCTQCSQRAMRSYNGQMMRNYRYAPYQQQRRRVSSRVPVINMPRIEGVN